MAASHKLKHVLYSCIFFFLEIVFEFSSQEDEIFNLSKQFNPQDLNRVMQHFKEIKRKN